MKLGAPIPYLTEIIEAGCNSQLFLPINMIAPSTTCVLWDR